jgi:hydroxymethylglutaryl-CoA reductase
MTKQPPFYRLTPAERRQQLAMQANLSADQLDDLKQQASRLGNELVENYVTDYRLPMGVVTGLLVNGQTYTVPMVTEEPSVIAAANNGAKRVRLSGGFQAVKQDHQVIGQVIISSDAAAADRVRWLTKHSEEIIKVANDVRPSLVKRGGGARSVKVRSLPGYLSVDIYIDVQEAMGANSVNTMAEAVGHYLKDKGFPVLTAILSNLYLGSLQTVSCVVKNDYLATKAMSGSQVATRIAQLSDLAQVDELRAATHNKGIMNGIDAAVIASGNDWRSVEASAHAYAAYHHPYCGLATWQLTTQGLRGELTIPLSLGVVGGSIKLSRQSQINYQISGIQTSAELAAVVASIGLAQNLAALRALASTGIQAGHMQLQYRSLALSAGAQGDEVDKVAATLRSMSHVDLSIAKQALQQIRRKENAKRN